MPGENQEGGSMLSDEERKAGLELLEDDLLDNNSHNPERPLFDQKGTNQASQSEPSDKIDETL